MLGFAALAALVTSLVSGFLPALQSSKVDLQDALRESNRSASASRGQNRVRNALVSAEVALSLALLVGAGLLIRSFVETYRVDAGFSTENRMVFSVNLPGSYREGDRWTAFLDEVQGRFEAIPQMDNVEQLDETVAGSLSSERFHMVLLVTFAGVALMLALAGIYGVLAYSVTRRTREIGVRMALGAAPTSLLRRTVGQGMRPVLAGIVIGTMAALAGSRWMTSMLFEVAPSDPVTYATVALVLTVTALGSCCLAAMKVLGVDPIEALQEE